MHELLKIRDLEVEFKIHGAAVRAVRGLSFDVYPGTTVALVGESGSGKSVTAQAIMGILPQIARISGGEILWQDPKTPGQSVDLSRLNPDSEAMRRIRGGRISMIFQEPMVSLSPLHTVGDQVSEALFLHRSVTRAEGMELTRAMLAMVGFPEPGQALGMYPFELSGGLRQRAMIAMALICQPALLIADEPTTALDVTIQAQILKQVKDLQAELGMAVLIITHDLGVVANVADEVVVMYHGECMESGTVEEIYRRPRHPYLRALMQAVPHFDMKAGERLVPVREIEHTPASEVLAKDAWTETARSAGPHLVVDNICRTFRTRSTGLIGQKSHTVTAVDDVSLSIQVGESFGLVGESGCGKTTLSKVIMRVLQPDSGSVLYNDRGSMIDVLGLGGEELTAYRRKVQFIFQDPFSSLNPRMPVFDIIREPLVIHKLGDRAYQQDMVRELMRMVGLDPRFLSRYPHSFSGGQRQRIGIARALALRPDMIICDEPVSALDVSIQAQVLNLLKDLRDELGLTYLFISHNLAVVDYVADRIAVMCRGFIVETAPREVLFSNPVHPYTQALVAAVPYPDLNRPLDFEAVMAGRASDPGAWPEPFTISGRDTSALQDLGQGHFVRGRRGANIRRAAA